MKCLIFLVLLLAPLAFAQVEGETVLHKFGSVTFSAADYGVLNDLN